MNRILGFTYHMENHVSNINDHFQSNSSKYVDAIDELLNHIDKTFPNGGELTIKKIIIYKLVNKK